jgi:hypothetical protein
MQYTIPGCASQTRSMYSTVQYTVPSTNRTQNQRYVLEYQQHRSVSWNHLLTPNPDALRLNPVFWLSLQAAGSTLQGLALVCDLSLADPLRVDRESQLSAKIPTQKLGRRDAKALLKRRFLSLLSTCESHNPQSLPREGKTAPKSSSWCVSR